MKFRFMAVVSVFILLFGNIHSFSYSAKAICLYDVDAKQMIYGYNEEIRMLPASITKIVTAITALRLGNPEDVVTVNAAAANTEGSSIYLKAGEKIKLLDLIYGMMLHSGNDAANAIAHHFGYEEFVEEMNETVRLSEATDSHFENPSGLDGENHRVTALDMAKLTAYAMKNPLFCEIVATKQKNIVSEDGYTRYLKNHNKLLWMYERTRGVKTGYTKKAGRTLVSFASDGERNLICVTLNDSDDWNDHISLYQSYLKKES
ncbi:MAG: D-alanyl-D-alanine carboxypeptidase [Clostridia bacterium]|nr:D-alanyl-D-alanine carboxypeptidase [Clostridia bacterium]